MDLSPGVDVVFGWIDAFLNWWWVGVAVIGIITGLACHARTR